MAWVKIGEAYTDNNGVATLPYTGTGRGVVRGMVKSTVDERIIQSETYATIDCILKDMATQSSHNDAMWTVARGQLNRGTEDTELVINSGQTSTQAYFNLTNTDSFVIEFDAMFDGSSNLVQLRDSSWSVLDYVRGSNYNKDTWYAIKIEVKNGQSIITVGNTQQTPKTLTGIAMFMFALTSSDNYFKFKNFKYYPI